MRRPNGAGTVYKLKGNRRNPWAARKTVGWNGDGTPIYAFVGFYPTRKEALETLERFNMKPSDRGATFGECAEAVLEEISDTSSIAHMRNMKASTDRCKGLWKMKMDDVRLADMQPIVDAVSESVGGQTKVFLKKVFDYAVRREILPVERPQIVHI